MTSVHITLTKSEHAEIIRAIGFSMWTTGKQTGASGYLRDALTKLSKKKEIDLPTRFSSSVDDRVRFELVLPVDLNDWMHQEQNRKQCALASLVVAAVREFNASTAGK